MLPRFALWRRATGPCIAAAIATAVLAPGAARATVVKALSLAEKVQLAPLVVRGVVERIEPSRDLEDPRIWTLIAVEIREVVKGDAKPGQRILLRQAGGRIGEQEQRVEGVSRWTLGEEAILFLEPYGPYLVEIGIGIGKYPIEPKDGGLFVTHDPDVALGSATAAGKFEIAEATAMDPERLDAFLKRIRNYAALAKKQPKPKVEILEPRPALPDPIE